MIEKRARRWWYESNYVDELEHLDHKYIPELNDILKDHQGKNKTLNADLVFYTLKQLIEIVETKPNPLVKKSWGEYCKKGLKYAYGSAAAIAVAYPFMSKLWQGADAISGTKTISNSTPS